VKYELKPPFKAFDRYGFQLDLDAVPRGDHRGNPVSSRLYLFEDGKQIGESHHGVSSVGAFGKGRFVHWEKTFYFSSSDGSNINDNGRQYHVVWSDDLYFQERTNYFHSVLVNLLAPSGLKPQDLAGKNVLEVGCGRNHGMSIIMAGYGANVVAVDRYAPVWDDEFHADYINYLIRQGNTLGTGFDGQRLQPLLQQQLTKPPVTFLPIEAENVPAHYADSFDLSVSVAALEHFFDMDQVAAMLHRTTRADGIGCHSIDFRDHRDFGRPLEFLLLSDAEHEALYPEQNKKYVHGNRVRPDAMQAVFERHGFITQARKTIDAIHPEYIADFLPRLRASGTRFVAEPEATLAQLAVIYVLRKN
jgi:SAM-dependent methyltransferase